MPGVGAVQRRERLVDPAAGPGDLLPGGGDRSPGVFAAAGRGEHLALRFLGGGLQLQQGRCPGAAAGGQRRPDHVTGPGDRPDVGMCPDHLHRGGEVVDHQGGGEHPRDSRGIARVTDPHEIGRGYATAAGLWRQGPRRVGRAVGRGARRRALGGDDQGRPAGVDRPQPLERGGDVVGAGDGDGVGGRAQHGRDGHLRPRLDRQPSGEPAEDAGGRFDTNLDVRDLRGVGGDPVLPAGGLPAGLPLFPFGLFAPVSPAGRSAGSATRAGLAGGRGRPAVGGGVQQCRGTVARGQRQGQRLPASLPGRPVAFGGTLLRAQFLQPVGGGGVHRHRLVVARGELAAGGPDPGELRLERDPLVAGLPAAQPGRIHRLGHPDDLRLGAGGPGSRSLDPAGQPGEVLPPARRLPRGRYQRLLLLGERGFEPRPAGDDLLEAVAVGVQPGQQRVLLLPDRGGLLLHLLGVTAAALLLGTGPQQPGPLGGQRPGAPDAFPQGYQGVPDLARGSGPRSHRGQRRLQLLLAPLPLGVGTAHRGETGSQRLLVPDVGCQVATGRDDVVGE